MERILSDNCCLGATFPIDLKSPRCLKKIFFWKPINWTQISNCGRKRPGRPAKKTSSYCKLSEVTHSQNSGRGRGSDVKIILLKLFFQNSWSCPRAYRGAGRRRKSPLDGATDFLWKIWQHITRVSFVSAFIFVFFRKPKNASGHV